MENVTVGSLFDPGLVIAEGVNWQVASGEYWVVAGLHGSGKSDFLMMTGGVMPPLAGRYQFLGQDMPIFEEPRLEHRLRLGLVFDGGRLLNHLTVWENVALPLRYHRNLGLGEGQEQLETMLEATQLTPWAHSTPGTLGRNWQRRAGLARALMLQPELLLIDNPLAGLDPRHTDWWLNFLDEISQGHPALARRPVTLVVTAADMQPFKNRAQQFAVLQEQRLRVAETGT